MPATSFRSILVAMAELDGSARKALRRAADIARRTGASLTLFHAAATPLGLAPEAPRGEAKAAIAQILADRRARIERLANRLRREELTVHTSVTWAYPAYEAILQCARQNKIDLLVIEAHRHSKLARVFLPQTDVELIRHSPLPVLIVKGSRRWRRPRVLAAVDPFHSHDKPAALDAMIAQHAFAIASRSDGIVHAVHIYPPLINFVAGTFSEPIAIPIPAATQRRHHAQIRSRVVASVAGLGVPKQNTHLRVGDPALELPRMVRSLNAQLVVMGAVSRSAIQSLFIGHTAERVLDALPCDVMIVKPKGFRDRRARRRHA
jgi:universal stress protein E